MKKGPNEMSEQLRKGQWATYEEVCEAIAKSDLTQEEIGKKAKRILRDRIDDLLRQLPSEDLIRLLND